MIQKKILNIIETLIRKISFALLAFTVDIRRTVQLRLIRLLNLTLSMANVYFSTTPTSHESTATRKNTQKKNKLSVRPRPKTTMLLLSPFVYFFDRKVKFVEVQWKQSIDIFRNVTHKNYKIPTLRSCLSFHIHAHRSIFSK